MTSHYWGDPWFRQNGDKLRQAENFIVRYVRRWSGCYLISKEKYGTIRYEYILPPGGHLMQNKFRIRLPGYKKVVTTFNGKSYIYYTPRILWSWNKSWLYKKWTAFGWRIVKRAVFNAIQKWPQLKDELLVDLASNSELVGQEIHDQYWISIGPTENNQIPGIGEHGDEK